MKAQQVAGQDSTVECGCAAVVPRKGSIFPRITGLQSCKKWLQTWFYVKNQKPKEGETPVDLINLRFYYSAGPPPKKDNFWDWNPDLHEGEVAQLEELEAVHNALTMLIAEGLTAGDLLRI